MTFRRLVSNILKEAERNVLVVNDLQATFESEEAAKRVFESIPRPDPEGLTPFFRVSMEAEGTAGEEEVSTKELLDYVKRELAALKAIEDDEEDTFPYGGL